MPVPGPGQVLIKMKASGICGSDIRAIYREHLGKGDEAVKDVWPQLPSMQICLWHTVCSLVATHAMDSGLHPSLAHLSVAVAALRRLTRPALQVIAGHEPCGQVVQVRPSHVFHAWGPGQYASSAKPVVQNRCGGSGIELCLCSLQVSWAQFFRQHPACSPSAPPLLHVQHT